MRNAMSASVVSPPLPDPSDLTSLGRSRRHRPAPPLLRIDDLSAAVDHLLQDSPLQHVQGDALLGALPPPPAAPRREAVPVPIPDEDAVTPILPPGSLTLRRIRCAAGVRPAEHLEARHAE